MKRAYSALGLAPKDADPERLDFPTCGYARRVDSEELHRNDLARLVGAVELLLSIAERINGEIADEAILADLYELRERAYAAMLRLSER